MKDTKTKRHPLMPQFNDSNIRLLAECEADIQAQIDQMAKSAAILESGLPDLMARGPTPEEVPQWRRMQEKLKKALASPLSRDNAGFRAVAKRFIAFDLGSSPILGGPAHGPGSKPKPARVAEPGRARPV